MGGRNPESHPAPPGDIRAFDVRTGKLRWSFHTIPHPGEPGYETWPADAWKTAGAANNWAGMALDAKRGIVYAPTGSAVFDFYGGDRVGDDLYADTLLALDADTGKRLWHFQGVHHDMWDRDFPSPPRCFSSSATARRWMRWRRPPSRAILYRLRPGQRASRCFPIHEHPFPASTVPGEVASPTQPVPDAPEPFARPAADGGYAHQPHSRGARLGGEAVSHLQKRRAVCALWRWTSRRWSFRALTGARNGADRPSIPRRTSSM